MVGVKPSATADGSDKLMMETISEKTFSFAEFELDTAKRLLLKAGQPLALNPKAFDLLAVLVNKHGQILSKDELLETVWEGSFVEENNLTVHISALRKIFGEKKGEHQFIVTIPGKGYKFVAEIRSGDENVLVKVKESLPSKPVMVADGEAIIGRAAEIAEIKSLIGRKDIDLITLTGAGGAGKTSLAQVVGNELKADFADGVFFVELAAVRDADIVAPTIMQTLGVKESEGQNFVGILKNYLGNRQILLILDNFEQIAAAAPLVRELLEASAELKILITSRVALHLENETEFPVNPLSVPPTDANLSFEKLSDYSAVKLFIKCAQTVKPNFILNGENATAIAGICHKLDGLPLAIELAAVRINLLSPQSILERLENSLKLLTGGAKDLPERQRTMRGAVWWSYELLDEDEQTLFRRLAVFAGGFTVEAAEAICEKNAESKFSVLDILTNLIENNLLVQVEKADGNIRLQMLEVVREFAAECLENSGEAENIRRRHSEFFLALAEETEPLLFTEKVIEGLEKLDGELDNLRAALRWLLNREIEMMVRMAAALRHFWINRSYLTEARRWLEVALEKSDNTPNVTRLKLLNAFSLIARNQGDYAATRQASEESLTVSRAIKDLWQIILSCHAVAGLEIREGNLAMARKLFEEALVISRELNDEKQIAITLSGLGNIFLAEDSASAARKPIEESLEISKRLGFKFNVSIDSINLGTVAYYEGNIEETHRHFAESLMIARELDNKLLISCCLDGFAAVAAMRENFQQSAVLSGNAENLRQSIGYERELTERRFFDDYSKKVRYVLGEKSFTLAYKKGGKLDLNEAITLTENLLFNEQATEIIIETHKLEHVLIEEEIVESESVPKLVKEITQSNEIQGVSVWLKKNFAVFIIAFLVLAAIGGYFWLNGKSSNGGLFANSSVKQLTTNGKVGLAALSPDGKNFAYTTSDLGQRSLWLGFIDGGNHLQLRPAADAVYSSLTFSPNGKRLYFSYRDDKNPKAALYKMPVPGGVAEKVLDEITDFSLSPDGTQIAFSQSDAENKKEILLIADLKTAEKRETASLPKSYYLSAINSATISWSSDGKRLAFASAETDSFKSDIVTVEISSGKIERLKSDVWRDVSKTAWMADGNGLIITAVGGKSWASVVRYSIIHVELPSGKTHDITTDRSSYGESLSLSAASDLLLSVEHRQLNNVWIAPVEDLSAARQITFGSFGKYEGLWGMDFTPDGKIIYTNSDTESQFISQMNADGTEQKQLTASGLIDSILNVSGDGRFIVFHSNRSGGFDIWRMNIDGSNPVQLTFGKQNYQPFVSADNLWVYYKSWENGAGELRRVSIDGGEPEILNDKETSWLSFSPDGKYFAASYVTDKQRLAIFSAETSQVVKQFDIPKGGTLGMGSHWTPDSKSVVYRDFNYGYWQQSIEGGEAKRLEGLPKEKFYNFTFSKDGKWFAFVRGQEIRDVIMISNGKD